MAKILIIGQARSNRAKLKMFLQHMGHSPIETADNLKDAAATLEAQDAAIIFLDLAIGKGAKALMTTSQAKLVALVYKADQAALATAKALHIDSYLVAPFTGQSVYNSLSIAFNPGQAAQLPAMLRAVQNSAKPQVWRPICETALARVQTYVKNNLDCEISLKTMSEIAGMSQSNFSRRFKAGTGLTPYQYVMKERLEAAKFMLRYEETDLVSIAAATGFSSQAHFTTVFGKATQMTPFQYRRL